MVRVCNANPTCSLKKSFVSESLYKDGDVIIGGLFPVHVQSPVPDPAFTQQQHGSNCQGIDLRSYRWLRAMIFTVDEINRDPVLLPNVTLGYLVADTCLAESTTLSAALALVTGQETTVFSTECNGAPMVPVIIGDARSSASVVVADTLGVFDIPMVSYFASCACLSDKHRFHTFLRTVPSDAFQAKAMARLLHLLDWNWVGVVAGDDEYGKSGSHLLLKELEGSGVCVDYVEVIPKSHSQSRIKQIMERIQSSTASVVVTFAIGPDLEVIFKEMVVQNVTNRQWIATEAWSTTVQYSDPESIPLLAGTIGFALRRAEIKGLGAFLTQLNPVKQSNEPFVKDVWEEIFRCSLAHDRQPSFKRPKCTGSESVEKHGRIYTDVSQLRVTYNVYKAVYAIAYALHNMIACLPGRGPFENGQCPDATQVKPRQLLHYLNAVNFTTPVGELVYFENNGEPSASYDIMNWYVNKSGEVNFVQVGQYDAAKGPGQELNINIEKVIWGGGWGNQVPVSVCSVSCLPGTRKVVQKRKPICCFDCIPCAAGEISNMSDSTECMRCPEKFWSNTEKTKCIPKVVEFLSLQDTMGIVLTVLSVTGATLTTTVLATFFHHRDTPLVRAYNSELSFLLLMSLTLCFLCALVFIGRPAAWNCMLRHTLFGVSFVTCIGCILSKTVVVLVAFRATRPGSHLMQYFGPIQQRAAIFICTLVQVVICLLWLLLDPPQPTESAGELGARLILQCTVGSVVGFVFVLGYIGMLAVVCFLLAFFARKLPDNFNEAKFITFSMFIFCAVWAAFVPAYISSPGKYTVAVEIFAILASSYGLLICIFTPKCYIILLKPEKNTKKTMMAR
ncbi:olfactory receptor CS1 [Danio rerio]|uniref:Olfactory receptor C family, s1 n=1 Tax=Danio rerio TaxID=7955 RepID=A0A0R4IV20_DANRE|nr:olfactory receptor CS1 [Danio rerio]|eukprot:NP_001038510.1 pheromone receptor-like [Danio rerio]